MPTTDALSGITRVDRTRRPGRGVRVLAGLVCSSLVAMSCSSSGEPSATTPTPSAEDDTAPTSTGPAAPTEPDYAALAADVLAMPDADQQQYLMDLAATFDQQLALETGLQNELGGPDAAATALREAWAPLFEEVRQTLDKPIQLGFRSAPPPNVPDIGEALFGAMMTIGLGSQAAVSLSNDLPGGKPEKGEFAPGMTVDASTANAALDIDVSNTSSDGVTTKLKVHLEVAPCPAADGTFKTKATAEMSARAGSSGGTGVLKVDVVGHVDDNAKLASKDVAFRMDMANFSGGKGSFADVSGSYTGDTFNGLKVNRTAGSAGDKEVNAVGLSAILFGLLIAQFLGDAAQKGWESGRCVRIDTTAAPGPKGLDPAASATITAAPRSKLDGTATGGTVAAQLAAGGAAVEPSATPVKADAEFTYTAPDERNKSGTVALEARSKRGVGKASIDLDTNQTSYKATYSGGGITITGTIADLAQPFTTDGEFAGGTASFEHIPADDRSGSISVGGGGSGVTLSGSGTYTIVDNGDGTLTMNETISSCTAPIGGCRDTSHAVLLTPV